MSRAQIHSQFDTENLLRFAGVRRVHYGWYTVEYRGPVLDRSTVCSARRNPKGELRAWESRKRLDARLLKNRA